MSLNPHKIRRQYFCRFIKSFYKWHPLKDFPDNQDLEVVIALYVVAPGATDLELVLLSLDVNVRIGAYLSVIPVKLFMC